MPKQETKLTSVKIPVILLEDFQVLAIRTKFSIQKLTERAMYLYVTDDSFRSTIHQQLNTIYTGSI